MKDFDESVETAGVYLYAIVRERPAKLGVAGLEECEVSCVAIGSFFAIVTGLQRARVRPERRSLEAHSLVLRELLETNSVLPIRFGTMAKDMVALRLKLEPHVAEIDERLSALAGTVEMGVRVSVNGGGTLAEKALTRFPHLAEERDRILRGVDDLRAARVAIGREIDHAVRAIRDDVLRQVVDTVAPTAIDVFEGTAVADDQIAVIAALVQKSDRQAFEAALDQHILTQDSDFVYHVSGPWAPFHFTNLVIG